MAVKHNERCKECKKRVFELLTHLFGDVERNYNINLSLSTNQMEKSPYYMNLNEIYSALQNHRGNTEFVRAKKLPNVDFYIKDHKFILEFDESQHFTTLRKLTLEKYPEELKTGFNKDKWINICKSINAKDNDPIYRDEQRAWYDTLRDFAPSILNLKPTVRIYSKDCIWCKLDAGDEEDLQTFKEILSMEMHDRNYLFQKNLTKQIFTDYKSNRLIEKEEEIINREAITKSLKKPKINKIRHNNINRHFWDSMEEGENCEFKIEVKKIEGKIKVIKFEKLNNKKPEKLVEKSNNSLNENIELTITKNSNYIKTFLLADKNREKLFKTDNEALIQLYPDNSGNLFFYELFNNFSSRPLKMSLKEIGTTYLQLEKPSAKEVLKYFVTPEMEIERIFNNLRFKYLQSIYLSGLENSHEYINADYNKAFQSIAGMSVYQGSVKLRKDNNDFWKEAGFKSPSKTGIRFENERNELRFILKYIRSLRYDNYSELYRELIAIKPGFHEMWVHGDYFESVPSI